MKFQTKQEFEIYALMYVMALDMRTSKEELKLMKTKAPEELIQNVSELFENDNDAQRVEAITAPFDLFSMNVGELPKKAPAKAANK